MKTHSFILAFALLCGTSCDSGSSAGGGPSATGGASSGGAPSDGSGGNSSGGASGGASSGGSASGGTSSGSGGSTPTLGGAGGGPPSGQNDPSCPEELPEEEETCFVYPNVVCSYEDAPTPLGDNCICVALRWDCTGCPAEPIHGEMNCSGYEGEACGACFCSDASPNWDCGDD
jgi:hypothetical protein